MTRMVLLAVRLLRAERARARRAVRTYRELLRKCVVEQRRDSTIGVAPQDASLIAAIAACDEMLRRLQ